MSRPREILVMGLPKSATTGMYNDLVKALKPNVVDLFEARDNRHIMNNARIRQAMDNGATLMVKLVCVDHDSESFNIIRVPVPNYESFMGYEKKIFMVRDPRDNLVSYMLYMVVNSRYLVRRPRAKQLISLIQEKEANPRTVSVRRILALMSELNNSDFIGLLNQWRKFSVKFLDANSDFFLFKYEDYIAGNMNLLEDYLGFQFKDTNDVPREYSFVARTKKSGDWRNWFLDEDVDYFRPGMQPYMEKYGYPDDWTLPGKPTLDPACGSGYVSMLVEDFQMKFMQPAKDG